MLVIASAKMERRIVDVLGSRPSVRYASDLEADAPKLLSFWKENTPPEYRSQSKKWSM
jgi:hypothetical protein